MVSLEILAECLRNGMALVRLATDSARPLEDLFDADDATSLRTLTEVYFGDTPFTGYRRRAIADAEEQRHSLEDLLRIEQYARRLRDKRLSWKVRAHLCGVAGGRIDAEARAKLKELRRPPAPRPLGVRHLRGEGEAPDTLIYRGASGPVTRLRDFIDQPDADAAVLELLDGSAGSDERGHHNVGDSRNRAPEAAPHIVMTLDDVESLQHGNEDVLLTLTNGARMSGAEWAAARLHEVGFVTLLHPVDGPVNLYRTSRFPNLKQRLMAAAESPLCGWPSCRRPASRSQIHHLRAWKHGGDTNASNLTVLCDYHNGINHDDGPATDQRKPPRGRMERHAGAVRWVPD